MKIVESEHSVPKLPIRDDLELSVVIPCLNEAETLGICIEKARRAMNEHCIRGEIVVADNGSTDGSDEIALRMGARVVRVAAKGYGNALMGGISGAGGRFIIMGDADDSYDFLEIPRFIEKLRRGFSLVQGCRLPSGGGTVAPGAMPPLHRWLGNPMLTFLVKVMFGSKLHDVYCGLRGFTKQLYHELNMRCSGMEFATEMIIKANLFGAHICEVPITLHPDGRKLRRPHLRTFRDGWRTLRFYLMCSPRWLFLVPGMLLALMGLIGYGLVLPRISVAGVALDAHTLLFASMFLLLSAQSVLFAISSRYFAVTEGILPPSPLLDRFTRVFTVERGIAIGAAIMLAGTLLLLLAIRDWYAVGFGRLDYAKEMRLAIPGTTLVAIGFQTILSSFFISIFAISHKRRQGGCLEPGNPQ
jgi:glycosyltransferase involved in cell wall biosynthesis